MSDLHPSHLVSTRGNPRLLQEEGEQEGRKDTRERVSVPRPAGRGSGPWSVLLLSDGGPGAGRAALATCTALGPNEPHPPVSVPPQPISSLPSSSTTRGSCWPPATRVAGSSSSSGNRRCGGAWWEGDYGSARALTRRGPLGILPGCLGWMKGRRGMQGWDRAGPGKGVHRVDSQHHILNPLR